MCYHVVGHNTEWLPLKAMVLLLLASSGEAGTCLSNDHVACGAAGPSLSSVQCPCLSSGDFLVQLVFFCPWCFWCRSVLWC